MSFKPQPKPVAKKKVKPSYKTRKNKYSAVKQTYKGRPYDSKAEARYAAELDWRKKAGEIIEINPQFKIELRVKEKKICNYYMDFRCVMKDGSIEYHEVKGLETGVWKLKWKLLEATIEDHENAKLVLIKV